MASVLINRSSIPKTIKKKKLRVLLPNKPPPLCCVQNTISTDPTLLQENHLDYERLSILGQGSYGTVYKVRHNKTSQIYALKVIRQPENPKLPSTETKILNFINSPYLIKCHNIFFEPQSGSNMFLMDYMDGGTLSDSRSFSESSLALIAKQVLKGLEYLRANNIAHLDIKPSNLLVDSDFNVKISDFGVSMIVKDREDVKRACSVGTSGYMSPERLDSSRYECDKDDVYAGDVWSLGVTLLELFVGYYPFCCCSEEEEKKPMSLMEIVVLLFVDDDDRLESLCRPEGASEEFVEFIKCCLEKNPKKRWTVSQLLLHPFLMNRSSI